MVATTCLCDRLAGWADRLCSTGEGIASALLRRSRRFSTEKAKRMSWINSTPAPSFKLKSMFISYMILIIILDTCPVLGVVGVMVSTDDLQTCVTVP